MEEDVGPSTGEVQCVPLATLLQEGDAEASEASQTQSSDATCFTRPRRSRSALQLAMPTPEVCAEPSQQRAYSPRMLSSAGGYSEPEECLRARQAACHDASSATQRMSDVLGHDDLTGPEKRAVQARASSLSFVSSILLLGMGRRMPRATASPTRKKGPLGIDGADGNPAAPLSPMYVRLPARCRRLPDARSTAALQSVPRPPDAPEKSSKEAQRHQRQYDLMRRQFQRKEARVERRREEMRESRERRMVESAKQWPELLQQWEARKGTTRTKELVWLGIPPSQRAHVWPLLLGNGLSLTEELFGIYVAMAARARSPSGQEQAIGREGTVSLIPLDLPRTFPSLSFFQPDGPLHSHLRSVLEAYVCYRPDVGYVQGMSYLASMFLLFMDPVQAFICLANFLNRPLLLRFYRMEMTTIDGLALLLDELVAVHLPVLQQHLTALQITPYVFIMDWVLTVFTKSLSIEVASRIWDIFFLTGEVALVRAILAVLKVMEADLLAQDYDQCMVLLTHLPAIGENEFFEAMRAIKMTARDKRAVKDFLMGLEQPQG